VFVAASALGLYTHYVAGIVLALQASWALITQSGRRKEIFAANAIALLIFLPWYPRVNNDSGALLIYQFTDPLTLSNILGDLPTLSIGSAYSSLGQVPGRFSEVLIILAVATIVVELVRRAVLPRVGWSSATHRGAAASEPPKLAGSVKVPWAAWLPPLLVVGIPTVTVLYSLKADISIYEIRHIMTLIPYLCVVVGVATALLSRRVAWVVGSVLVVALLIGSVRELSKYPRLDLQGAAQVINKTAPQGSVVVEPLRPGHLAPVNEPDPLQQGLPIYLDHRFLPIKHPDDASEWPKGRDVYLVQGSLFLGGGLQFAALSAGAQPVQSYDLDGWQTVNVTHYAPVGTAKPPNPAKEQERAIGNYIATHPEAFQEYLQQHPDANRRFQQALQKRLGAP